MANMPKPGASPAGRAPFPGRVRTPLRGLAQGFLDEALGRSPYRAAHEAIARLLRDDDPIGATSGSPATRLGPKLPLSSQRWPAREPTPGDARPKMPRRRLLLGSSRIARPCAPPTSPARWPSS